MVTWFLVDRDVKNSLLVGLCHLLWGKPANRFVMLNLQKIFPMYWAQEVTLPMELLAPTESGACHLDIFITRSVPAAKHHPALQSWLVLSQRIFQLVKKISTTKADHCLSLLSIFSAQENDHLWTHFLCGNLTVIRLFQISNSCYNVEGVGKEKP